MNRVLHSVAEVREKIRAGYPLLLAGDEQALSQLPPGEWVGGTIPYFIDENGGNSTREKIFATELQAHAVATHVSVYDTVTLESIYRDIPRNGFGFILIPGMSDIHLHFALRAPLFPKFATQPLLGWVSGVHLSDLGRVRPKVFDGRRAQVLTNHAVVMHVDLPENWVPEVEIANLFVQGTGDTIAFSNDGFSAREACIAGESRNLAGYIAERGIDTRLPLVADYSGTPVNVSFRHVDVANGEVTFFAPVFRGIQYRLAAPVADYTTAFTSRMPSNDADVLFSCNCILNYLYSKLEGRRAGNVAGPVTFGEIAYQLLNQTMVYLTVTQQPKDGAIPTPSV